MLRNDAAEPALANYAREKDWVERVHGATERTIIERYLRLNNGHPRRVDVHRAMDDPNRAHLSKLVRDANSVNVVISEDPKSLNFTGWDSATRSRIGWPPLFGVPPGVLISGLRSALEGPGHNGDRWVVKAAELADSENRDLYFDWKRIESPTDLTGNWLVAVHPSYARYDAEIGLKLGEAGAPIDLTPEQLPPLPRYHYKKEGWLEHAQRIVAQAQAASHRNRNALASIAALAGVDAPVVQEWVEVVCALHDVGKLGADWQQEAWRWQHEKEGPPSSRASEAELIAHTDFDPIADRKAFEAGKYRLPTHAVEGALATSRNLGEILSRIVPGGAAWDVWLAMIWAIGRHHKARASSIRAFRLHAHAASAITLALPLTWKALRLDNPEHEQDLIDEFRKTALRFCEDWCTGAWPFYVYLVRQLRLADQAAVRDSVAV